MQSNVKAWLQKATIEYMGEQDKDFVDFVLLQLREKCSAHHLIKEVKPNINTSLQSNHPFANFFTIQLSMLEDDAEEFVAKLWRFLLLESNSFSSS